MKAKLIYKNEEKKVALLTVTIEDELGLAPSLTGFVGITDKFKQEVGDTFDIPYTKVSVRESRSADGNAFFWLVLS